MEYHESIIQTAIDYCNKNFPNIRIHSIDIGQYNDGVIYVSFKYRHNLFTNHDKSLTRAFGDVWFDNKAFNKVAKQQVGEKFTERYKRDVPKVDDEQLAAILRFAYYFYYLHTFRVS